MKTLLPSQSFACKAIARASIAALLVAAVAARAASASEPPKVSRVLVFGDRAEVTRTGELACASGAELEFGSLPPSIDPASLRAEAGSGTIESVSLQQRPRGDAFSPEAAALEEKLRGLSVQLDEQRNAIIRAQQRSAEARKLTAVGAQQIGREMPIAAPDVKSWGTAYDLALAAELRAGEDEQRALAKRRSLLRSAAEVQRQLAVFAEAAARTESFAKVRVSCPHGAKAQVELTYVVGGASWTPAYEARASEPREGSGEGQVELALFGTVVQRTGEDWAHAQLILSTAVPRSDATPPELAPLHVYADKREPPKKVLVRRDEQRQHAEAGGQQAKNDAAGIEEEGLSAQFAAHEPADVRGDGTPARLLLTRQKLPATFAWRVVPSQLPFVFRAADLVNTAPFALLPGQVDLFRKSGLMGRADLPRVASGAPFHLAFGLEERIKVKRVVVEELAKDTGVFSKGKRFHYDYAFELQSLLPDAASVELQDHVPVSELDDVEVGFDEKTTPGYELRKDDGLVRWTQSLKPNEKKRVELSFHVDVPSSYDLGGL